MRIRRPRPRPGPPRVARSSAAPRLAPHQVDPAIDAAVDACRRHDVRKLAGCVALLAAGPAGPAGPPRLSASSGPEAPSTDVDLAVARRLLSAVGDAWAAGWQPADLARVVSRERGRRHARLAAEAIVRDAALYPPAAVPRRWREQVDDLAAAHKAGRAGPEEAWAVRPVGEDRAAGVRLAIEVLALVHGLPPVPKLGAVPGGPGAGEPDGEVDARMLQRVRGLLAKAESTTFPEEAEALTAKAQELMARYAIDAAWVAAERGRAPEVGGRRVGVDDPYAGAKAMLLEAIASANRCRSVWSKSFGYATVFGDEADLEGVELLYTSLLVQAARAMLAPPPGRAGGRSATAAAEAGRTRSFRQSFLVSFAVRIGDRLAEAVEAATAAAAEASSVRREALLPVLAGQRAAAEAACEAAFPEVRATTISARDWAGWHAGKQAAEAAQLDLHAPVRATRRRQLGG
jgi:hypothetical protein